MKNCKSFFKFIIFFVIAVFVNSEVSPNCYISYPSDENIRPLYNYVIGTRQWEYPLDARVINIVIYNGTSIRGYCAAGFSDIKYRESYYNIQTLNSHALSLSCTEGKLYLADLGQAALYPENDYFISCNRWKWSLYEPSELFDWCEESAVSYALANNIEPFGRIVGKICFDIKNLMPLNIRYLIGPEAHKINQNNLNMFSSTIMGSTTEQYVKVELAPIKNLNLWWQSTKTHPQYRSIEHLLDYELATLAQGTAYPDAFEIGDALKVYWWKNLLLGNWKNFINALNEHIHQTNVIYTIYTGVSGAVQVPINPTNCPTPSPTLEISTDIGINNTVPLYIWSYLQTMDGEEFVVIGYNSPFSEYFSNSDIIFCEDMCASIDWLHEIQPRFNYSMLGILFCCRADDVRDHLKGFPLKFKPTSTLISTTTPEAIRNSINIDLYNDDLHYDD